MSDGRVLDELGFYTLAGQPGSSRRARRRGRDGRGAGPRLGPSSPSATTRRRRRALSGAAGAVSESHRHRHRGHQPQHPPPASSPPACARTMHSLTGGRFTLGLGRGIAPHAGRLRHPAASPPRSSRTSPASCAGSSAGEVIIGHDGPAGSWPVLHLDATSLDEYVPLGSWPSVPRLARARRPLLRRGRAPHLLHRRDHRPVRADREGRRRAGRPRPRRGEGLVVLRHRRRPHPRGHAPQEDGRPPRHLPPGLRRPAGAHERLGPRRCWTASGPTR